MPRRRQWVQGAVPEHLFFASRQELHASEARCRMLGCTFGRGMALSSLIGWWWMGALLQFSPELDLCRVSSVSIQDHALLALPRCYTYHQENIGVGGFGEEGSR